MASSPLQPSSIPSWAVTQYLNSPFPTLLLDIFNIANVRKQKVLLASFSLLSYYPFSTAFLQVELYIRKTIGGNYGSKNLSPFSFLRLTAQDSLQIGHNMAKKTFCQCSKNLGKSFHWCCIKNAANVEIDYPGCQRIFIILQILCCLVLPVSIGAHCGDSETFPKSQYQSIFTKTGRLGQRMDKYRLKFQKREAKMISCIFNVCRKSEGALS